MDTKDKRLEHNSEATPATPELGLGIATPKKMPKSRAPENVSRPANNVSIFLGITKNPQMLMVYCGLSW